MIDEEQILNKRIKVQEKKIGIYNKIKDRMETKIQEVTVEKQSLESQKSVIVAEKLKVKNNSDDKLIMDNI